MAPAPATLVLAGATPTLSISESVFVAPATATLMLTGGTPTVSGFDTLPPLDVLPLDAKFTRGLDVLVVFTRSVAQRAHIHDQVTQAAEV